MRTFGQPVDRAFDVAASALSLEESLGHASAKRTLETYADMFDSDLDSVAVALDNAVTRISAVKTQSNSPACLRQAQGT